MKKQRWRLTNLVLISLAGTVVTAMLLAFSRSNSPFEEKPLPSYIVKRIISPIVIDGMLNEESWLKAQEVGDFFLADGTAKASSTTHAKMLWDSSSLYLAFECFDTDIIATMTARDDKLWEEEVVEIFFAPYSPEKFGYTELEVSPRGTALDLYVREVRGVMPVALPYHSYNLNLRVGTSIRGTLNNSSDKDTSWTVEIAIPLRDIQPVNLPPISDGDIWKMNLYRMERFPVKEFIAWSPTLQNKFHVPSRFGSMMFSMKRVSE